MRSFVLAAATSVALAAPALARDQVQIAGSSTVLPFANVVAEQFGKTFPQFKAPIVGSGGSSAGLKQFCTGLGPNTIDIANSSRPIRPAEMQECKANGVAEIVEVRIGYDGIVFASSVKSNKFALTDAQIYQAVAANVPRDGKLVPNPFTHWNQIDKSLPAQEILLFIPGEKHGTREVFEEKVLDDGCKDFAEIKALSGAEKTRACRAVRKDGRSVDIDGDYPETVARIERAPHGIGVFGLSFYDQNRDKVQVATVNGVVPSEETIASGKYPVSRPLFFYVKKAHVGQIPGLRQFIEFFLSDRMIGPDGMVTDKGLIPMPAAERTRIRQEVTSGKTIGS
jgi:phosphate transport system substrate-binding protein